MHSVGSRIIAELMFASASSLNESDLTPLNGIINCYHGWITLVGVHAIPAPGAAMFVGIGPLILGRPVFRSRDW
ncbi:MAG: hypothetical protein QXS20_05535 [Candidatus Thorarchaeota archaeon]